MAFKNLGKRVAVAVVGGPLIVLAVWYGGYAFFALVAGITLLATYEFLQLLEKKDSHPPAIWIYLHSLWFLYAVFSQRYALAAGGVLLFLFGLFTIEVFRRENNSVRNASGGLLAFVYLTVLYAFMLGIRQLPLALDQPYRAGGEWVLLVLLAIWACDTAAYFVGSRFGRHKLAPRVSPNKTVEGALGGVLGAMLTAWLCQAWFAHSLSVQNAWVIGGLVGVFGQLSDLVESLFKRDAGVKDTSSILPGHGGILDRFDSPLLAMPAVFVYLLWLFRG